MHQFDPAAVLRKSDRPIDAGSVGFRLDEIARQVAGKLQIQPLFYLQIDGRDIGFARGEFVPDTDCVALHVKILNALQHSYRGRGIGTVVTMAFAHYMWTTRSRVLASSRSNSAAAMAVWERLVRGGYAVRPPHADLTYLLSNSERAARGLPDKFITESRRLSAMADRYRVRIEAIEAQRLLSDFYRSRLVD